MPPLSRRQFLGLGAGVAAAGLAGTGLVTQAWPLLAREDLVPGRPPDVVLEPRAWRSSPDHLSFAVIGDNGSGGRQAMAVAERMAHTYAETPFEQLTMLGDICYYGSIEDRFHDVFVEPMKPLIDAGVRFELAIGNHDGGLHHSEAGLAEIDAELRLLGTPSRYYATTHGPVDFFTLDTSAPGLFGPRGSEQLEWLDDSLASAGNQWRIVCLHHPLHSSGRSGPTPGAVETLEPILARHHVDLVLAGHDHHYERTVPIEGVTHIVSGGGCKVTGVRPMRTAVVAQPILQFLHVQVDGDRLSARCIRPDGRLADRFELRAREGR